MIRTYSIGEIITRIGPQVLVTTLIIGEKYNVTLFGILKKKNDFIAFEKRSLAKL